ncbi:uncharacterized protein LOC112568984 isoform X2 [Pomacea canaliculata]|uniref:uncharacterized protein LOC112568984 isoform X2 n=1 Tax=Pomacea canaliculata TaxID=400727 RepID=UPI000D725CDD|nr:uncharacterized protein LOC112568984 isoform X2 [Pomacea canaliculata]
MYGSPQMSSFWLTLLCSACGTTGIRIINCNNNKVEIFEDSPAPVTCGDITSVADVYWRRGDGVNIGDCSAVGTCSPDLYNDYRLSRSPQSTESQLTLIPDYRRHAGVTVTCQDGGGGYTASCTLVIRRHSELSECHVTTNPVDWTVSGSCRVQQAFSSDNIYTCTWTRNTGQPFGGFDASRELCSFTQALPQAGGLYTYSISVSPPATTAFSQQLTIVEPGDVTTTCPHWVVRGGDLSCTCQTTNTASPPATVRWEGRDSEKLVKTNVQREDNGTQFTCHVTWAGRVYTSINYTLMVAGSGNVSTATDSILSSAPTLIGPIVGAVVAVVVTAIISIVLVIIIRRRRSNLKREAPEKTAKIQTCKDSEFEDHINEVYDSSETAGPHSSCGDNYRSRGQGTDREASHRNKQEVSAQYEDSPSGGYYSEIREVGTGNTYPQPHHRLSMNPYSNRDTDGTRFFGCHSHHWMSQSSLNVTVITKCQ